MTKCPIKVELTVYGYIREAQQSFINTHSAYYNIPDAINNICLSFYYSFLGWDSTKCGSGLIVSGLHEDTVTVKDENYDCTVYHRQWYHSQSKGFVKFRIYINALIISSTLFVGFATFEDPIDECFVHHDEELAYVLQCDGDLWVKLDHWHKSSVSSNATSLKGGDEAIFTLNLDESKIYISKNGDKPRVIFQNIENGEDIKYKFAIGVAHGPDMGAAVTIRDIEDYTYQAFM